MDALVTTEWLDDQLGAPDLRVVDASMFLPDHGRDARAEFEDAHIPGAVFLNLAELADSDSDLPSMVPPPEKFASRLAKLGLGDGTRIVLYDNSPLHSAARAWWLFKRFGLPKVAILDGGLAKWRAEERHVEGGPGAPRERHLTLAPDMASVRDLDAMRENLQSRAEQVVDARSPARFAGSEPESRPGLAAGHIPGAINLPYAALFNADGTWKRDAALRAAFEDAGVDVDAPIVTSCGSGVTAAILVFGLHLLGRRASLYDGSWTEWGSRDDTPKATGAA